MISAEAPVMFAKVCEIFVQEMTEAAWTHTEENKRRTLQRNDVVAAVSKVVLSSCVFTCRDYGGGDGVCATDELKISVVV